jgi:hypothetical protein
MHRTTVPWGSARSTGKVSPNRLAQWAIIRQPLPLIRTVEVDFRGMPTPLSRTFKVSESGTGTCTSATGSGVVFGQRSTTGMTLSPKTTPDTRYPRFPQEIPGRVITIHEPHRPRETAEKGSSEHWFLRGKHARITRAVFDFHSSWLLAAEVVPMSDDSLITPPIPVRTWGGLRFHRL